MDYKELAQINQEKAWRIIEDTNVIDIWENIGAKVNLVGSLKSKLLVKNRDIDFHIYTPQLSLKESFSAIRELAENKNIKEIQYKNLIETEEECIEWHAWYEDGEKDLWQMDLIHIRKGSRYDGVVEKVTDAIIEKITPEIKDSILKIKYEISETTKIPGIIIYQAVFSHGIRSYRDFVKWFHNTPVIQGLDWLPE